MIGWAASLKTQARTAAQETVEKTAQQLAVRAAGLTPVKTGRLKAAWQVAADPGSGAESDKQGTIMGEGKGGSAVRYVINATPYALEVELGTLGRPGRCMAQQARDQLKETMGQTFLAKMNHQSGTVGGDDLESINQLAEPEEIVGNPSGIGS